MSKISKTKAVKSLLIKLSLISTALLSGCANYEYAPAQIDNDNKNCIVYRVTKSFELIDTPIRLSPDECLKHGYFVVSPADVRKLRIDYLRLKRKYDNRCKGDYGD